MSKKNRQAFEMAKGIFDSYFADMGYNKSGIRFITYNEIKEDKKSRIYSAVIEYNDFRQYVNFYERGAVINSIFDFDNCPLCHFGEILNVLDSDDLSFYTYDSCYSEDLMKFALENIMQATEKYFNDLISISNSQNKKDIIFNELKAYCNDEDLNNKDIAGDVDLLHLFYGTLTLSDEDNGYIDFLKDLRKKKSEGKELDAFEKRAYRVMSKMSKKQLKEMSNDMKKTKEDRLYLYAPYVFFAIVFAVIFGFVGVKIQGILYDGYIGVDYFESALGFATAGAAISVIFTGLIDKFIYKIIVPKSKMGHFNIIYEKEKSSDLGGILALICCVVLCGFFTFAFCFSGAGFNEDNIKYREYCFQKFQTYSYIDVEIAEIDGSYSDGVYSEYLEPAYAFNFDGEWYEYGAADSETQELLNKKTKEFNKKIKTYRAIEDIE